MSDTYLRVCTLPRGHDGEHLPYKDAPAKDEFGNRQIANPRCLHVDPVETGQPSERFRVVFELINPLCPEAGWHEVVNEHADEAEAVSQLEGLRTLEREGDDVRNARVERARISWEPM